MKKTTFQRWMRPPAATNELEQSVIELVAVAGPEAAPMIRQLSELAKLGFNHKAMASLAEAAEKSQIVAFEYGKIRRIGAARTLREILEDDAR